MLFFLCFDPAQHHEEARGLSGGALALTPVFREAWAACGPDVRVVDGYALGRELPEGPLTLPFVPAAALRNTAPRLPVEPVAAAGGLLARRGAAGLEVLLIRKRGLWDLPKGKCKRGETAEACALREVGEELGIRRLRLTEPAGRTTHAYAEGGRYKVKTTDWFFMETPERTFHPEVREGISEAAWKPWAEALEHVKYPVFADLLRQAAARADALTAA